MRSSASVDIELVAGAWGTAPVFGEERRSKLRLSVRLFGCIAVLVFFTLLFAAPLWASSWRITDFQDIITINKDGSAVVVEQLTLNFDGEFHGIHRTIPIHYPGPSGTNYELLLKVLGVTEGGEKLKYESSTSKGTRDLKIYIPDAVNATRTVEITYQVRNGTRFFDDYDEFYWNVTGNDWPVPINHASASVNFPAAAAGSLRAQAFTGSYGGKDHDATTKVEGANVSFETTNPLLMRGGLTVDVFIPKEVLQQPGAVSKFFWFLRGNPIVFLPAVILVVMFSLWWIKGRDPDPGMSVAPMYEPPVDMSPAEAGTLLDDTIHPRDITSTVIDLAVRGYIKIEEVVEEGLIFKHKDYIFHLLKPSDQWDGLTPHEKVMIDNVFGLGDQTRLSDLRNRFYTAVPLIQQDIKAALKRKGMYSFDPEAANGFSIVAAIVLLVPFGLAQYLGWADFFNAAVPLVVCVLISGIIWWLFTRVMTAKTVKGVKTRIAVLGFQEFMNRVDGDRLKLMPPTTFEKFLPYAMALGVEHHWAQAFAGIVTSPPNWYVASGGYQPGMGFNPVFFSSSMHSMAGDMHDTFVSAPRASSSGSGFGSGGGGGGFSGGGFGGGGGSAF